MSSTPLSTARPGDQCVVLGIAADPPELRGRLYALGVIPGSRLEVLRRAPLGDPLQLRVSGACVSMRKSEAELVQVDIDKR